jgi:hypothetical protein
MGSALVLLVWRTVTDMAVDDNQSGPVIGTQKGIIGGADSVQIVCIRDMFNVPLVCLKTFSHILAEGPFGGPVQGHFVVVVDPAEIGQPQVASE